jgi:hypothetical protein
MRATKPLKVKVHPYKFNVSVAFNQSPVCGRVVKVVDFKPLAPHRCGFEFQQGLWILSCVEAIQLAYGMSVVLLRCPFMPEKMHRGAPEVFLHQ